MKSNQIKPNQIKPNQTQWDCSAPVVSIRGDECLVEGGVSYACCMQTAQNACNFLDMHAKREIAMAGLGEDADLPSEIPATTTPTKAAS
jgi:hypothetical protein